MTLSRENRLKLGISSCLLGRSVRYDGGHKRDPFLIETLGRYVDYVPVCPEVECGLATPREAMRLQGDPDHPRLLTTKTGRDMTGKMESYARRRVEELEAEDLCGFIFKSKSPSSGMERVKVYDDNGVPSRTGSGVFARIFMEHFPLLPTEEEGRLHDPDLRENFIERIFTVRRWKDSVLTCRTAGAVVDFHTRHKLMILAHDPERYKVMGRHVAASGATAFDEMRETYEALLLSALKKKATPATHTNVLLHAMGYFKNVLTKDEKAELRDVIDAYRREVIPLIVPITLLQHYVRKYNPPYLPDQVYLNPHPYELRLRNHV